MIWSQHAEGSLNVNSTYDEAVKSAQALRTHAQEQSPLTFGSYCQLRAEAIALEFGQLLAYSLGYARRSIRAQLVPQILGAWVRSTPAWTDPAQLERMLGPVDLPFRRRRAMLMLQTINQMYADPTTDNTVRAGLDELKTVCRTLLLHLRATSRQIVSTLSEPAQQALRPVALGAGYVTVDPTTHETRFSHRRSTTCSRSSSPQRPPARPLPPPPRRPPLSRPSRGRAWCCGRRSKPPPGGGRRRSATGWLLATSGSPCGTWPCSPPSP